MSWCDSVENESGTADFMIGDTHHDYVLDMLNLFRNIDVMSKIECDFEDGSIEYNFWHHVHENLLFDDDDKDHLPITVFSYIAPTMNTSFLLHVLLSMGRFETEVDIFLHPTMKDCFRYCGLIGDSDDEESLQEYVNDLTKKFIVDQMQYFPNSKKVIDFWIITTYELFKSIIIDNVLPVTERPLVQLSVLLSSNELEMITHKGIIKSNCIDAAFEELVNSGTCMDDIPCKEALLDVSLSFNVDWDPLIALVKNKLQSQESFLEQKFSSQHLF